MIGKGSCLFSVGMGLALMFGGTIGGDVPAAVVADRGLVVAAIAVERAAVEKLFQPGLVFRSQLAGVVRQR